MQLLQLNDIVMGSLEANADAMLAHWQLRLSQLVKVDSGLVGRLQCEGNLREKHLIAPNSLHSCLVAGPQQGDGLRAHLTPPLARAIHCGDSYSEVRPSALAWVRRQGVRLFFSGSKDKIKTMNDTPCRVLVLHSSRQMWRSQDQISA